MAASLTTAGWFLTDNGAIAVLEAALFAFYLIALFRRHALAGRVQRGKESSRQVIDVSVFAASAVLGLALNFASFPYRTVVFLVNLAMLYDMFFVNQWSQNEILGWITKLRKHSNLS